MILSSIRKQIEEAMGASQQASLPVVYATALASKFLPGLSSCPDFPYWGTVTWR